MRLRRRRMWIQITIGVTVIVIAVAVTLRFANPLRSYPSKGKPSPKPTIQDVRLPSQPGTLVYEKSGYRIDYSHADQGYISVIGPQDDKIKKVQVLFDGFTYTYDLGSDRYTILPLQKGTGEYTVRTMRNTSGNAYTVTASTVISATVADDLTIYLYPNQIVDYDLQTLAVNKSFEITQEDESDIQRVHTIYRYVIDLLSYDQAKADRAKDIFMLPDLDETLTSKKGICFDYAALMTAMLRVQGIPTRLITGYTDIAYHAWVEIYLVDVGWINPKIYFESKIWKRVDPTFDDSFGIYFGDYQTKYTY